jgi:hypothetical protein
MIDSNVDIHVELASAQKKIEDHLGLDNATLIFDFSPANGKVRLDLITVNPRHNQSFLFHTSEGYDKLDVLKKMFGYVTKNIEKENHYTIQWRAKGETELHTSYFRARNMYEALDKLYYGRDINTLSVFHVTLNPIT